MSFKNLNLQPEIVQAVEEKGYTEATPIQLKVIPLIIERHDILASAQTGTGKTAGFTLPLLQVLMNTRKKEQKPAVRALVLTPTRELASQIGENVKAYGKHLPFRTQVIFGGVNINAQIQKLQRGADILIATPGRLLDLVSQGVINLSQIEILVLDEADRMLDMGFIHDIKKILKLVPAQRQNLLFSATFSAEIKKLAAGILKNPQTVEVAKQNATADLITHTIYPVDNKRKRELLSFLISTNKWEQVLVFTRTKHGANKLAKQLSMDGIISEAIHGNKSQSARTKALADFKSGKLKVLVATDIAARGLDIDQLPHVVNFELPNVPEDYVHRIGRTGRCGNEGWACSLVCVDELHLLAAIERLLKHQIPKKLETGFEVDQSIAAEPIPNGRNTHSPRQGQGQGRGPKPQSTFSPRRQNASRPRTTEKSKFGQPSRSR
ncbi:MAG: DEAD/DEAH box helicase [Chlamydiales bacterium]|nr:DEAD/DEAH box helicase [Chlamydiales bacterium]